MKAGLIGDDHVQGRGIGFGNLAQKEGVNVPINGRRQQQFAGKRAVDFQGFMQEPHL